MSAKEFHVCAKCGVMHNPERVGHCGLCGGIDYDVMTIVCDYKTYEQIVMESETSTNLEKQRVQVTN